MAGGSGSGARGSGGGARGASGSSGGGARRRGTGGRRGARRPSRALHHVLAEDGETQYEGEGTSGSDVEEDLYHLCLNDYKSI
ncbi:rRNA 2'-O-methyltransferase fibrillarin-like isoform X2 [Cydia strobilella]